MVNKYYSLVVPHFLLATSFLFCDWDQKAAYSFIYKAIRNNDYQLISGENRALIPSYGKIVESFSPMVILDLLGTKVIDVDVHALLVQSIINARLSNQLYSFFFDEKMLPADVDCVALAYTGLIKSGVLAGCNYQNVVELVLTNTNSAGIIETYFDVSRKDRIDPVVGANALYFLYLCGQESQAQTTQQFVLDTLLQEKYKERGRYYPSEDTFLYMISRLLDFPFFQENITFVLQQKLIARLYSTHNPLDLAMRVICSKKLKIQNETEAAELASLQESDGGWPAWAYYKKGRSNIYFGSRVITTAFAIKALIE